MIQILIEQSTFERIFKSIRNFRTPEDFLQDNYWKVTFNPASNQQDGKPKLPTNKTNIRETRVGKLGLNKKFQKSWSKTVRRLKLANLLINTHKRQQNTQIMKI